jgi:hypothetical protein
VESALVNPKGHDEELIAESITRFGYIEPIVMDERTGRLVSGHGRARELRARQADGTELPDGIMAAADGSWLVPVNRGWASANDDEAHAAGIAINQGTISGGFTGDLPGLLSQLQESTPDGLLGTGFTDDLLPYLLAQSSGFPVFPESPNIPAPVTMQIGALTEHPRNYQQHTEAELEHLCQSISEHRFYKNIVVARDLTILAGHGAVVAAKRLGYETVPVVRLDIAADSTEALKIVVADNEIGRRAARDDRLLVELLQEIKESDPFGLAGTGYDDMILANLLFVTRPSTEISDFDAANEWLGLPDFEPSEALIRLIINFDSEVVREEFVTSSFSDGKVTRGRVGAQTWSAHWPAREEPRESRADEWVEVEVPAAEGSTL